MCKMGRHEDEMANVDFQARMIGVGGLGVVDASAFPFLPPGHPQVAVGNSYIYFNVSTIRWLTDIWQCFGEE